MDIKQEQMDMKQRNLGLRVAKRTAHTPAQFRGQNQGVMSLLLAEPKLTFQEIGARTGLTKQRIAQINNKLGVYGRRTEYGSKDRRRASESRRAERAARFIPNRDAFVEYRAYVAAKARCTNPKHPSFKDYGARGIEFRFTSFAEMFNEIGHRPEERTARGGPEFSLNRIENNGHYAPGNVEWAPKVRQCATGNRRKKKSSLEPQ